MDHRKAFTRWVPGGPNTTFNQQLVSDVGEADAGLPSHVALRVRHLAAYCTDDAFSVPKFRIFFEGKESAQEPRRKS